MKIIFVLLIGLEIVFAQVQTVCVGKIDKQYTHLVSKDTVIEILEQIETLFETELGFNVFDYAVDGKPIDILYIPPSQKKKRILKNQKKSKHLKIKIDDFKLSVAYKQAFMKSSKSNLESEYGRLNSDIRELNRYISRKKLSSNISKYEYEKIKRYVSKEQTSIHIKKRDLDMKKRQLNRKLLTYKNKLRRHNSLISKYNYLQRDIEKLSKNHKEVKGITKKRMITTTRTTYVKGEIIIMKKDKKIDMEKIEIYDFENINLLKVILAHEIGHLVGVIHIDSPGALMNPYIQREQIKNLSLSSDDIKAFKKSFRFAE